MVNESTLTDLSKNIVSGDARTGGFVKLFKLLHCNCLYAVGFFSGVERHRLCSFVGESLVWNCLTNAISTTIPYGGHGASAQTACGQDLVVAFITYPDAPLDTSCTAALQPQWVLPAPKPPMILPDVSGTPRGLADDLAASRITLFGRTHQIGETAMKLHHMITLSAALLTLTACTAQVVQPAIDNSAAPVVEAAAPVAPAATPAPLAWQPCSEPLSADLECAQMQVADGLRGAGRPDHHAGADRVKATDPDKRIGSLIINPGGPGGAGSDILNVVATIQPSLHRQAARVLRPRWL